MNWEWLNLPVVTASLRVMGLGMSGVLLTSLAFWGAIIVLRRLFPATGTAGGKPGQPGQPGRPSGTLPDSGAAAPPSCS